MKAPKGMEDMAERLRAAATTPALTVVQSPEPAPIPPQAVEPKPRTKPSIQAAPAKRVKGAGASMSVFLRVPAEKYAELEGEAIKLTKATGKGVTVQQIILERL